MTKPSDLLEADKLIFPGVGSFGQAMKILTARGLVGPLKDYIAVSVGWLDARGAVRICMHACMWVGKLADTAASDHACRDDQWWQFACAGGWLALGLVVHPPPVMHAPPFQTLHPRSCRFVPYALMPPHMLMQADKPFLGICLGLQLLFEGSEESGGCEGLSVIPGAVTKFDTALGLPVGSGGSWLAAGAGRGGGTGGQGEGAGGGSRCPERLGVGGGAGGWVGGWRHGPDPDRPTLPPAVPVRVQRNGGRSCWA